MSRIIELIETTTTRGVDAVDSNGHIDNQIRQVQQLWTKEGVLVAESDGLISWFEPTGEPQTWQPWHYYSYCLHRATSRHFKLLKELAYAFADLSTGKSVANDYGAYEARVECEKNLELERKASETKPHGY